MKTGKYGLPLEINYCTKCVISNQRPCSVVEHANKPADKKPTIHFDNQGVCDACRWAEMKQKIDWEKREQELTKLLKQFRSKKGNYDVIVPGSGGKDSTFTTYMLKDKYQMHPLTVTWAPHLYTEVGWRNFQHWIHAGVDNFLFHPNGRVHRQLTRLAFLNLCHPFQPFVFGQKNFPLQMAVKHKIRLVFLGENEAEYGNQIERNFSPFYDIPQVDKQKLYFGGVSLKQLKQKHGITEQDLQAYLVPSRKELNQVGVEVRYLGYYLKWSPHQCIQFARKKTGLEMNPDGRTQGTYTKYVSMDDKVDPFHYFTTYIKFGVARATHDACQDIRSGRISRQEAIRLVKKYDSEFPDKYFKDVLAYMGITAKQFWATIDQARPKHLWEKVKGKWQLRMPVWRYRPEINTVKAA